MKTPTLTTVNRAITIATTAPIFRTLGPFYPTQQIRSLDIVFNLLSADTLEFTAALVFTDGEDVAALNAGFPLIKRSSTAIGTTPSLVFKLSASFIHRFGLAVGYTVTDQRAYLLTAFDVVTGTEDINVLISVNTQETV